MSRDFKRLGDLAAGTVVVYEEALQPVAALPEVEPAAPPLPLSVAEQRALLDFAERVPALTEERAAELADVVPALTAGLRGPDAVRRLAGYAAFYAGERRPRKGASPRARALR